MGLLTTEMEKRMLLWAFQDSTNPQLPLVQPVVVRLVSANGDAVTTGTEVVGETYEEVDVYFALSSTTPGVEIVNTSSIEFNSINDSAPTTVAGVELWDSSSIPVRIAYAALASPVVVSTGSPFTIGIGQLKVKLT